MKVVHSWLKDYLGEALPDPEKVEELLTFHAFEVEESEEVAGEVIIDVKILPDRGSDSLSHRGVARELATILGVPLEHDPLKESVELPTTDKLKINIEDSAACPRFTLSLIAGVKVGESPKWLKERLAALGQRSINNIVDATNYVMYAIGQPLHAYDADKFPKKGNEWHFGVRFAKVGEQISLLAEGGKDEERVVVLAGSELLITDAGSDLPVGLAGVKGGRLAELDSNTTNIIIEAASFDSVIIRKTARRLGILTDASKRFENAPARELPLYAQKEITELITKIAGGSVVGWVDEYPNKYSPIVTTVHVSKVNAVLGLTLSVTQIKNIIEAIGATVREEGSGVFLVTAPWERNDLIIEADYIEEVGRIHGLSNIQSIVPSGVPLVEVNARHYYTEKIRQALLSSGFSEVITSSFQSKGKLQLQNSLASDKSCLRESLVNNITNVLDANFTHCDLLGIKDMRVFEIGTVFAKVENGICEHTALTLGARTKGNGYNPKDDTVLKIGMEAVEKTLGGGLNWKIEKGVAELDFSSVTDTLPRPSAYDLLLERKSITYRAPSLYPAISRDIALWVESGAEIESVSAVLKTAAGSLLVRHTLFDTFTKEGRTSYAFRLVFQATDRTLTDVEINKLMDTIYTVAKERGWEVR